MNDADTDLVGAIDALTMAANRNVEAVNARMDAIEIRLNRSALGGLPVEAGLGRGKSAALKSFENLMRYGEERIDIGERKNVVIAADDGAGGYLSPPDFQTELIRNLVIFSPIRQLARIGTTAAGAVLIPKRLAQGTATWSGETETHTEAKPAFGMETIEINQAACYIDISSQMLEDSAIDLTAELTLGLAEEFGRQEGLAGISGTGVKQPEGVLTNKDVTSVVSGSAADVPADALFKMFYDLPAFYRNRSAFALNGTTLGKIRTLKDGEGNYLWQPGLMAGQPETLLSRPVVECVDVPDIAPGATPIVLGDWQTGYRLIDRLNMYVLVDRFTLATSGKVRFHGRRRVGGGVVQAAAFRKMLVSA
jgi:HK97 family phage major capsid protein